MVNFSKSYPYETAISAVYVISTKKNGKYPICNKNLMISGL